MLESMLESRPRTAFPGPRVCAPYTRVLFHYALLHCVCVCVCVCVCAYMPWCVPDISNEHSSLGMQSTFSAIYRFGQGLGVLFSVNRTFVWRALLVFPFPCGLLLRLPHLLSQGAIEEDGTDVNSANTKFYDWTPLHYAADADNAAMVGYLVQRKANVNLRAADGRTALQWAQERGCGQVRSVLEVYMQLDREARGLPLDCVDVTCSAQPTVQQVSKGVATKARAAITAFFEPLREELGQEGFAERSAFTDVVEITGHVKDAVHATATSAGSRWSSLPPSPSLSLLLFLCFIVLGVNAAGIDLYSCTTHGHSAGQSW